VAGEFDNPWNRPNPCQDYVVQEELPAWEESRECQADAIPPVEPNAASLGAIVTIRGYCFGENEDPERGVRIYGPIGTEEAEWSLPLPIESWTDTRIKFIIPPGGDFIAGNYSVRVFTEDRDGDGWPDTDLAGVLTILEHLEPTNDPLIYKVLPTEIPPSCGAGRWQTIKVYGINFGERDLDNPWKSLHLRVYDLADPRTTYGRLTLMENWRWWIHWRDTLIRFRLPAPGKVPYKKLFGFPPYGGGTIVWPVGMAVRVRVPDGVGTNWSNVKNLTILDPAPYCP